MLTHIDEIVNWFYIFIFFGAVALLAVVTILVVSLIVYIKTGVHIKDWIEDKFPRD